MNPKIIVFSCNWDGWSCIEDAASSGLYYPASVKVIRVGCLSRIHAGLILKAFELKADGVMLLGCEPGNCHYWSDSKCVVNAYEETLSLLKMLGLWEGRLVLVQLPAFDGSQFVAQVAKFLAELEKGPAPRRSRTAVSKTI